MPRKKQPQEETNFNNAQDFGLLYNYVRAVNEIVSGQGEFFDRINLQLNGQVDSLIRDPESGGYSRLRINELIKDNAYIFGLGGLTNSHFNRIANFSVTLADMTGKADRGHIPSLEDVDALKEKYDKSVEERIKETREKLEETTDKFKAAKKANNKARHSVELRWLLGVPAVLLALSLVGGLGFSVWGVVSSALSTTFGFTTGFAIFGSIAGIGLTVWGLKFTGKLFSKVVGGIKDYMKKHKGTKAALIQEKANKKGYAKALQSNLGKKFSDEKYEALRPYPGRKDPDLIGERAPIQRNNNFDFTR